MKTKLYALVFFFILYCQQLHSQSNSNQFTRNCIYGEIGGQGLLCSINYEYRISNQFSGRIGYTNWNLSNLVLIPLIMDVDLWGFPIMLNYLKGNNGHYAEVGLGVLLGEVYVMAEEMFYGIEAETYQFFASGTGTVGYRYQPESKGLLFRVGIMPLFNFEEVNLNVGLSFGVAF